MSTPAKVALVAIVLIGGFCAALPFRKALVDDAPLAGGEDDLELRPGDAPPRLVPLQVSTESDVSPAAGALPGDSLPPPRGPHPATIWRSQAERADAPPPQLEQEYRPWPDGSWPPQLGHVPIEARSPLAAGEVPAATLLKPQMVDPVPMPLAPPVAERAIPGAGVLTPLATGGQPSVSIADIPFRRHRLTDGDTLVGLAERYYGDRNRAAELFDANRGVLSSPDLLPIGIEIVLPGIPPRQD